MVTDSNGDRWLTPKEAASKLGISVSRIYHIRDMLTYRKAGTAEKARLFFLDNTLCDDYFSMCHKNRIYTSHSDGSQTS